MVYTWVIHDLYMSYPQNDAPTAMALERTDGRAQHFKPVPPSEFRSVAYRGYTLVFTNLVQRGIMGAVRRPSVTVRRRPSNPIIRSDDRLYTP